MKSDILASAIVAQATSLRRLCQADVSVLMSIADVLAQLKPTRVDSIIVGASAWLAREPRTAASAGSVGAAAEQAYALAAILASVRSKDAELVKQFAAFLRGAAKLSEADVLAALAQSLNRKPHPGPTAKSASDPGRARELADRLTAAQGNHLQFDAVVDELQSDKTLNSATVVEIAQRFLGSPVKYKNKKEAVSKIKQRYSLDALNDSRGRIIGKIAV